jgi:hypothetical protein
MIHCPKTHEKFPSSFGNAEVISSDRRKLFINIFSKTTWKLFITLQGILKKYCAKAFNAQVWARTYNLWIRRLMLLYTTAPPIQYDNSAENDKVPEKMAMRRFPHFIHTFKKLFINQAYN